MTQRSVSIRMGTIGKAQVKADFAEIGDSGDATAKRWARSYERASEDATAAIQRQARAADKIAAIMPQTATQMRINDRNGTGFGQYEGSAKQSASVFRELAEQEAQLEARTRALLTVIDPAWAAQQRYNAEVREAAELHTAGRISIEQFTAAEERAALAIERVTGARRADAAVARTPVQQRVDAGADTGYGDYSGSAQRSADAFRELLAVQEQQEARARSLISAIDPIAGAQMRVNAQLREAKELYEAGALSEERYLQIQRALSGSQLDRTKMLREEAKAANLTRMAYGQLNAQGADIIAQLVSGTSPVVVFAQQAGQITYALGLLSGADSSGGGGAAGASSAIGDLTDTLGGANDTFDAVTGASERLSGALGANSGANEANAGATVTSTTARQGQTAATGAASTATGANTVTIGANTAATEGATVATTGLTAAKARLLGVISGPWGTAIIGGLTLLGILAQRYYSSSDAADDKSAAARSLAGSIDDLNEATGRQIRSEQAVQAETLNSAAALRQKAIDARTAAVEILRGARAQFTSARAQTFGAAGGAGAGMAQSIYAGRISEAEGLLKKQEEALAKSQIAFRQAEVPILQRRVAEQFDANAAATGRYQRGLDRLNGEYAAGRIGQAAYTRQLQQLTGIRDRELAATRESERASGSHRTARAAGAEASRDAARAERDLASELQDVVRRFDPARAAAEDYAATLKKIAALTASGKLTMAEGVEYGLEAFYQEAKRRAEAGAAQFQTLFGSEDPLASSIGAANDNQRERVDGWYQRRADGAGEELARWQELRDVGTDFVDNILGADNWDNFADAGRATLAMLKAEFIKLALLNPIKNLLNGDSKLETIGSLFSKLDTATGKGALPKNAAGTEWWSGGMTLVGEHGAEIIDAPRGARISNAGDTRRLFAANDGAPVIHMPVTINAEGADAAGLSRVVDSVEQLRRQVPAMAEAAFHEARSRGRIR